jgi:Kef-type K+ transport system membrane component KefB
MNPGDMNAPLQLLVPLAGILIGGRLAAQISQRLGLPPVLGELILGLLIGPSLLGWIAPSPVINFMSEIGVILLMFMAGIETDVKAMRKVGGASLLAAIGGCIVPLVLGWVVGKAAGMNWQMSLFLGTVLTATSVSITAQTLREMRHLRSLEGSTILGAAVIDDVIGVMIFAVVMAVIGEGANPWVTLLKMALFFPISWQAGNLIIPLILKWETRLANKEASLAVFVAMLLLYAWSAEALGSVATITGAYVLGLLVARHTTGEHHVHVGMSALGYGIFIPVFFINIGLQANLAAMFAAPGIALMVVLIAVASKLLGSGLGSWLGGVRGLSALRVGAGMVSRGEVALVLAGSGLAGGVLNQATYSIIIGVVLATTLLTPALLRIVFASGAEQESQTLPAVDLLDELPVLQPVEIYSQSGD